MSEQFQYQVVAECVYATVNAATGKSVQLLMKGAPFPDDDPKLQVYLDAGYVAKTSGDVGGVDADGIPAGAYETDVPDGVTSTPVEKTEEQRKADAEAAEQARAEAEVAEKRSAAQAKLAESGGVPDGRSSQAVWAEYLVSRGSRYEDVRDTTKADLIKLAEQQQ